MKLDFNAAAINRALNAVPMGSQNAVFNKALPAAGRVAKKASEQAAPSGRQTGTTARQTESTKAKWPIELRRLMKVKVVKRDMNYSYALIGPTRPVGNVANFVALHPRSRTGNVRKVKLWGKNPVNIPSVTHKTNRFMEEAFAASKSAQQTAFINSLRKNVDKEIARLARG
jgi:hypothetical protein